MTVSRGKIGKSLAERGRPAMWANEQEAAVLSGMSPDRFRKAAPILEASGFPKIEPENGLRFIPGILRFWAARAGEPVESVAPPPILRAIDFEDDHTNGAECWPKSSSPTGYVDQYGNPTPAPLDAWRKRKRPSR